MIPESQKELELHQLDDDKLLDHMLQVRYEHAKNQDHDYSHLFRPKTRWELIRLVMYQVGVELVYAAELSFVTPILLRNGLNHTIMTMAWALSPTLGFICIPLVASFSDQLRSSWGRRRPVLLVVGGAVILGMLILPYGKEIGLLLGDEDVAVEQMSGFRWGVLVTVLGLLLSDFDIETSSGVARTYFMDVCILKDHSRVLTMAMIVGGIGGTTGYVLGAVDWQQTNIGSVLGSNEALVYVGVVVVVIIVLFSTVTSFREVSLPVMEKDELLRPITQADFEAEKRRLQAIYSVSGEVVDAKKRNSNDVEQDDVQEEEKLTCLSFFKNLRHTPKSLCILYLTQFLAQSGYLSYGMYFTDFVGSAVFEGDVAAPEGTPELDLYDEGVRFGCWGMAIFTVSTALYSICIEKIIKLVSARYVLVGGLLAFSIGMLLMAILKTKWMVLACCPTVGIMYATIYCVPFLLISQYHARNSFAMKDGKFIESDRKRGFGADVSMLTSVMFLGQLMIALGTGVVIDAFGTTSVIVYSASLFSFLAAITATQILYMEL